MQNLWDLCFDLISSEKRRITPNVDRVELRDPNTKLTLLTQNLKKQSPNTDQVKLDKQRFNQADIVWVFGPDGSYFARVDVREDKEGNRTGEVYRLHPGRAQRVVGGLPDNPDITLEDLLNK